MQAFMAVASSHYALKVPAGFRNHFIHLFQIPAFLVQFHGFKAMHLTVLPVGFSVQIKAPSFYCSAEFYQLITSSTSNNSSLLREQLHCLLTHGYKCHHASM